MFALKDKWWMQIIDGEYHSFGKYVFDEGLSGCHKEPGYLESCRKAFELIDETLNTPVTLDFYKRLNRTACSHFGLVEKSQIAMNANQAGLFRKDYLVYSGVLGKTVNTKIYSLKKVNQIKEIGISLFKLIANQKQDIFSINDQEVELIPYSKIITRFQNLSKDEIFIRFAQDLITYLWRLVKWDAAKKINGKYIFEGETSNLLDKNHSFYQPQLSHVFNKIFESKLNPIYRGLLKKIDSINSNVTRYGSQSYMIATRKNLGIQYNYQLSNTLPKNIFDIFKKTDSLLEKIVIQLFNDYYESLEENNQENNLRCICCLFQKLEWLHPFYDGQGRTDLLLLSKLLLENNFTLCILEEPYYSSCNTLDSWVEYLKEGMEKWRLEFLLVSK